MCEQALSSGVHLGGWAGLLLIACGVFFPGQDLKQVLQGGAGEALEGVQAPHGEGSRLQSLA